MLLLAHHSRCLQLLGFVCFRSTPIIMLYITLLRLCMLSFTMLMNRRQRGCPGKRPSPWRAAQSGCSRRGRGFTRAAGANGCLHGNASRARDRVQSTRNGASSSRDISPSSRGDAPSARDSRDNGERWRGWTAR